MNKNFLFKTKMFLLLCMLIPFAGISQTKNLISTNRVFPKVDKVLEFEKALAAHAQKYHTGTAHLCELDIQPRPVAGGSRIT